MMGFMRRQRESMPREDLTPKEIAREKRMGALGCLLYLVAASVLIGVFLLHLLRPSP